jgi:hypothetical protein
VLEDIIATVEGVRAGATAAIGVRSAQHETEKVCIVAETRLPAAEQPYLATRIRETLSRHGVVLDRVLLIPPRASRMPRSSGLMTEHQACQLWLPQQHTALSSWPDPADLDDTTVSRLD